MKIALVSSIGGHLTDLLALGEAFVGHELVWIVNDVTPTLPETTHRYVVAHAERDFRLLKNIWEFVRIFLKERPDVLVSAGAGPAVPAALVARVLGIFVIYLEPSCAVTRLTLTGKLMRPLSHRYYVQWQSLKKVAPWAKYEGGVF